MLTVLTIAALCKTAVAASWLEATRHESNMPGSHIPRGVGGPDKGPWMSVPVKSLLEGVLISVGGHMSARALEFGCGGSTAHFSRFSKSYDAIESSPGYYESVRRVIESKPNTELALRPLGAEATVGDEQRLMRHPLFSIINQTLCEIALTDGCINEVSQHASYWLQAGRFKQNHYNFILDDGMGRLGAAFFVLGLVSSEGRVVIHDFSPQGNKTQLRPPTG